MPTPTVETLTFLFTDIEGSTRLWEQAPETMRAAVDRHDEVLRGAIAEKGGRVFRTVGDAICAVFNTAPPALNAAVGAQRALHAEEWSTGSPLHVRVVLHTTEAEAQRGDYVGSGLNRIGRLLGVCHGGQTLMTQATQQLVRDHLPEGVSLRDLGRQRFRDMVNLERIYGVVGDALPASFPALVSSELIPNNLPVQATAFVGREKESAELCSLMDEPDLRLVTIVGPGGMGKTRLGHAVSAQQLEVQEVRHRSDGSGSDGERTSAFTDGVFFVPLAPLSSPEQIVTAIGEAIGFQFAGSGSSSHAPVEQLVNHLRDKQMLLFLDNFEHLLEGATLVAAVLERAPDLQLLVTSRERLHLRNEQIYPIGGLEFPEWETPDDAAEYTAVRLFVQSAQRVRPDFVVRQEHLTPLTRICRLVGGMPLGLELAAGWVDMLPLEEIAEEIQRSFDFLETEMQDVPDRQRSMRAVFDYSWQRLKPVEQETLAKLSVFRGGFTRGAPRRVVDASIRTLASLVSKSLLQVSPGQERYDAHELVRQYAADELAAMGAEVTADLCARHGNYYLGLLQAQSSNTSGSALGEMLDFIGADFDNIGVAWRWAVGQEEFDALAAAADTLYIYCIVRGRSLDGQRLFSTAVELLEHDPEHAPLAGLFLGRQGGLLAEIHEYQRAGAVLERSIDLVDDPKERAFVLSRLGHVYALDHRLELAEARLQEALEIGRMESDLDVVSFALFRLASHRVVGGRYTEAISLYEEALAAATEAGRLERVAHLLSDWSGVETMIGDYESASRYARAALEQATSLGYRFGEGWAHAVLVWVVWVNDRDLELARIHAEEAQRVLRRIGALYTLAVCQIVLSRISTLAGENDLALIQAQAAVAESRSRGAGITVNALSALGDAYRGVSELPAARLALIESLRQAQNSRQQDSTSIGLYSVAAWFSAQASQVHEINERFALLQQAVALAAFVGGHPATWHEYRQLTDELLREAVAELTEVGSSPNRLDFTDQSLEEVVSWALDALLAAPGSVVEHH